MYMKHLLVARRHDDKQSMVIFIYFYLDETDACLGVLGTPVYWDVLLQGEDPCIHVERAPRCLCSPRFIVLQLYSSMDFGRRWQLMHERITPNRFYW